VELKISIKRLLGKLGFVCFVFVGSYENAPHGRSTRRHQACHANSEMSSLACDYHILQKKNWYEFEWQVFFHFKRMEERFVRASLAFPGSRMVSFYISLFSTTLALVTTTKLSNGLSLRHKIQQKGLWVKFTPISYLLPHCFFPANDHLIGKWS